MARCDVCGNDYDKAFVVRRDGREQTFDSLECAIQALAPVCAHWVAASSDTASSTTGRFIAAPTARSTKRSLAWPIALDLHPIWIRIPERGVPRWPATRAGQACRTAR